MPCLECEELQYFHFPNETYEHGLFVVALNGIISSHFYLHDQITQIPILRNTGWGSVLFGISHMLPKRKEQHFCSLTGITG